MINIQSLRVYEELQGKVLSTHSTVYLLAIIIDGSFWKLKPSAKLFKKPQREVEELKPEVCV
jgi:hypothetical protein